jgi:hypothetical protein
MSRASRLAALAAVVVLAVVLFVVLKPDDDSGTSSTQSSTTTTTHSGSGKGTSKPDKPPPIANVTVKNGKPVGGVQDLEFGKGQTIQFAVTSDVADEVHVHGYDIAKDVAPRKPVKFKFKGDIDGEFEVELENRKEQIASLRVNP